MGVSLEGTVLHKVVREGLSGVFNTEISALSGLSQQKTQQRKRPRCWRGLEQQSVWWNGVSRWNSNVVPRVGLDHGM